MFKNIKRLNFCHYHPPYCGKSHNIGCNFAITIRKEHSTTKLFKKFTTFANSNFTSCANPHNSYNEAKIPESSSPYNNMYSHLTAVSRRRAREGAGPAGRIHQPQPQRRGRTVLPVFVLSRRPRLSGRIDGDAQPRPRRVSHRPQRAVPAAARGQMGVLPPRRPLIRLVGSSPGFLHR